MCVKPGLEGPVAVHKGSTVGIESLAIQGKKKRSQRCESDLKENPKLSSKMRVPQLLRVLTIFQRSLDPQMKLKNLVVIESVSPQLLSQQSHLTMQWKTKVRLSMICPLLSGR